VKGANTELPTLLDANVQLLLDADVPLLQVSQDALLLSVQG